MSTTDDPTATVVITTIFTPPSYCLNGTATIGPSSSDIFTSNSKGAVIYRAYTAQCSPTEIVPVEGEYIITPAICPQNYGTASLGVSRTGQLITTQIACCPSIASMGGLLQNEDTVAPAISIASTLADQIGGLTNNQCAGYGPATVMSGGQVVFAGSASMAYAPYYAQNVSTITATEVPESPTTEMTGTKSEFGVKHSSSSSGASSTQSTQSIASSSADSNPSSSSSLSTGAKAGIGVGAAIGALAILALIMWLFRRRWVVRRREETSKEESGPYLEKGPSDKDTQGQAMGKNFDNSNGGRHIAEADGGMVNHEADWSARRSEMDTSNVRAELEGNWHGSEAPVQAIEQDQK